MVLNTMRVDTKKIYRERDVLLPLCSLPASLYIEELENLLHESMLLSFNTEIEDGSIEEVSRGNSFLHA